MRKSEYLAEIAIQGDSALDFISCSNECAIYEVNGFDIPKITLIDFRQKGIVAIQTLLMTEDLRSFAPKFNTPALITLQEDDDENIIIKLDEPNGTQPEMMLWIAIGIRDIIPVYEYHFEKIAPLKKDSFAFIGLFKIPHQEQHVAQTLTFHNQI